MNQVNSENTDSNARNALINWMKNAILNGNTFEQINSLLVSKGYSSSLIKQYYDYVSNQLDSNQNLFNQTNKRVQNTQNNKIIQTQQSQNIQNNNQQNASYVLQMVNYIQNMESRGYSFQQIRSFLLSKGYSAQIIDEAAAQLPQNQQQRTYQNSNPNFNSANNMQANNQSNTSTINHKHEVHLPSKTAVHIIAIFISVIIVSGGVFFFVSEKNNDATLLDLIAEPQNSKVIAGENLIFDISVLSMGDGKETFDMLLTYNFFDSDDVLVHSQDDTLAISTSIKKNKKINIPEDFKAGNYLLTVISDYKGKSAKSSFRFSVINPDDEDSDNFTSNTTNTSFTGDSEDDFDEPNINLPPEIDEPDSGASLVLFSDYISRIFRTSRDADTAARKCDSINDELKKDICLSNVAFEFNSTIVCDNIENNISRDDCYLNLVMLNNFDVCSNIQNNQSRDMCDTITDMYVIQQYESQNADIETIINDLGLNMTVETVDEGEYVEVIDLN